MMLFDPYAFDRKVSAGRPLLADPTRAAAALLALPQWARNALCKVLRETVEGALDAWERTPAGVKREPPPFLVQHVGRPEFDAALLRQQTREGWHQLMGLELRLTVQVLEALVGEDKLIYHQMLAEQYTRVGAWMALAQLTWELKLLRYRASPAVGPLVYE